jgi:hypothetical protein
MARVSRRQYAIGKVPETAEEWASEILAGDTSLGCAASEEIYRPKHERLAADIRAIQRQARRQLLDEQTERRNLFRLLAVREVLDDDSTDPDEIAHRKWFNRQLAEAQKLVGIDPEEAG